MVNSIQGCAKLWILSVSFQFCMAERKKRLVTKIGYTFFDSFVHISDMNDEMIVEIGGGGEE